MDFMEMEICENGDLYDFISLYNNKKSKINNKPVMGLFKYDSQLLRSFYI